MRGAAWRLGLVLLLTVASMVWVFWNFDWQEAEKSLNGVSWDWVPAALAFYSLAHVLRALRFHLLLQGKVPAMQGLSILSVGYLAIHVVPARIGEFVRPYLLAERAGVSWGAALAVIVLERLADMLMLLAMLMGVALWVELPSGALVVWDTDILLAGQRVIGAATVVGFVGLGTVLALGERVLGLTDPLPGGALARRFHEAVRSQKWSTLLAVLGLSAAIWAVTILGVWWVLRAFPGMPSGLDQAFALWTITLTGMTVLPTAGFFGAYEAACSSVLIVFGVQEDAAKAFAMLLHLSQYFFTLGVGFWFLLREGWSLRELVSRSQESRS